jgi:PAS domain S-box-containing protein
VKSPEQRRRTVVGILAACLLPVLFLLAAENIFRLRFLAPQTSGQIVLLTSLSFILFLLLVLVVLLLLRNVLKLYADERSHVLGSRLRTRLVSGALIISFGPVLSMVAFSYLLMNRSMERWFSEPLANLLDNSQRVASELPHYAASNARAEAMSLAQEPAIANATEADDTTLNREPLMAAMRDHKTTLEGGFALFFRDNKLIASYELPEVNGPVVAHVEGQRFDLSGPSVEQVLLRASERADEPVITLPRPGQFEGTEYLLGNAAVRGGGIVVTGLPLPAGVPAAIATIRQGTQNFYRLRSDRRQYRNTLLLILFILAALTFFASSWIALFLSKQLTGPIEALADGMADVSEGHYSHRIEMRQPGELGALIASFNLMATDLESSRNKLESSTAQLSDANRTLEHRRQEIETILDTIPLAVVNVAPDLTLRSTNRAFQEMLGPRGESETVGVHLNQFFPEEILNKLERLLRRAQRMGLAAQEIEMRGPHGFLSLSVIVAPIERRGYLIVLDDVTELLRAQKQVAWKEIAQRVAHEIRNPLTPIALSAERIRRYLDRGNLQQSEVALRESSETISNAVDSLRSLVEQFALLARFPVAHPRRADLNAIVEETIAMFSGRLEGITIVRSLSTHMPQVEADPQALQRAIANLMENAAEAMQHGLRRELLIETFWEDGRNFAELIIADTGPGIADELRERLFLPYFSTKERGSGLGLAIAAQIVQEHAGSIRVEKNHPQGTRFIIEIPLAEPASPEPTAARAQTGGHA